MSGRDWGGLQAIYTQAADDRREESAAPPVACPNDGEPLDVNGNVRNCPFGDFRWIG